jgi:hypothetical protein
MLFKEWCWPQYKSGTILYTYLFRNVIMRPCSSHRRWQQVTCCVWLPKETRLQLAKRCDTTQDLSLWIRNCRIGRSSIFDPLKHPAHFPSLHLVTYFLFICLLWFSDQAAIMSRSWTRCGREVPPPRAGESKGRKNGRQNEYFKWKKNDFLRSTILNYWEKKKFSKQSWFF